MAIPDINVLGNPNVTEGNFQVAIEDLRKSVIGSGKAYDSSNTYSQYDTCIYGGVEYYSKINSNTGNTPAIGANWGLSSDLIKLIASPTTNALPKINADGTIKNSGVFEDSNGNVGIGDNNPQYRLCMNSPTSLSSTAGSKITTISKSTNVGNISFLQQQTVRTSTGSTHHSTEERLRKVVDVTEMGYIGFADNEVNIGVGSSKKFALNEYGLNVDFGSNTAESIRSNSSKAAGTDWRHFYGTSNSNSVMNIVIYGNGNILNANNSYGSLSDIKLKEKIIDATPKLDKLMKVRVVNYNLIGQDQKQIGVIAQEIEKIFPGLIDETKDTKQVEVEKERVIPTVEEVTEQKLVKEAVLNEDGEIVEEAIYQTVVITEAVAEHIEKYIELETIETGETTKSVKYSVLYMMMLKGMQEQQEIINSLTKRIEILEGAR